MSDKHYIGLDLTGFEDKGEARPVSRVTLYVDDENVLTAGDDTGLELTAECPQATQAMVNAILERVKGYKYKMYSATSANLDPSAELGDGITAGGIYSVISRISDGGDGYPDLDAPGEAEPEDEFPTEGPITKAFNKKISDTRASITKTAEEINLSVSKKVGYDEIISSINQTAEQITIDANKISLEGAVSINGTFEIDRWGYLQCTGGTIGGWSISENAIFNTFDTSGSSTCLRIAIPKRPEDNFIESIYNSQGRGTSPFRVTATGELYATGARISGHIEAESGKIAEFNIGDKAIYNGLSSFAGTANGVYVGTDGISLGGGKFKVDSLGNLTASSGTFTGSVRANQIQVGGDNGYITGSQIGSSTVMGSNIGSSTIGGGNIASSTIKGGNIGLSTVTAGNLYDSYAKQASLDSVNANIASFNRLLTGAATATYIHTKQFTSDSLPSLGGYDTHWSTITSSSGVSYTALCR